MCKRRCDLRDRLHQVQKMEVEAGRVHKKMAEHQCHQQLQIFRSGRPTVEKNVASEAGLQVNLQKRMRSLDRLDYRHTPTETTSRWLSDRREDIETRSLSPSSLPHILHGASSLLRTSTATLIHLFAFQLGQDLLTLCTRTIHIADHIESTFGQVVTLSVHNALE